MIEERDDLYGAASPQELAAETYENYKRFVNPPLARVMKLSGSPVEVRAEGTTIWDQTGKAYLDFAGGYGVFTLGHRHPRVVEAVRNQLDLISLSGKTMFNVLLGRASRRLAELAPGDLEISFWCNSGTE
ncbi:MAG: aminotransferase class III-fold pyridoxal phosphate-dependent enzyme, partial [Candidatus Cybelea sp.]